MGRETSACAFLAVLAIAEVNPIAARADIDAAAPAPAKIDGGVPAALPEGIDRLVAEAIAQGKLPGCVVAVGRAGGIVYQQAFGSRALLPDKEAMTLDTIFDLASLTKPIATATALMVLVDQGKFRSVPAGFRFACALARQGGDDPGHHLRSGLAHQAHRHRDRADGARGSGQDRSRRARRTLPPRISRPRQGGHFDSAASYPRLGPARRHACRRLRARPRDGVEAHHGTLT